MRDALRTAAVLLVTGSLMVACGNDAEKQAAAACAALMCNERQVCDLASSPPTCRCRDDRSGPDCTACARGYTMTSDGQCQPPVIDCRTNPGVCGGGTCSIGPAPGFDMCVCRTGYTGLTCGSCATGYQDNDGNGTCAAACVLTTCSGFQVCSDATGSARCACPGGKTGATCDQCPAGSVLRTSDNTCVQTCASGSVSCGSKKTCDTAAGVCVCRPEYTGDACDRCAPGFQDNDRNGTCTAACSATTCATGQTCSDSTGTARCACPADRTGTNCEMCLSGWVLRPSDNTCVQTCASMSCGARKYCDETQTGPPVCQCQAPYAGTDCASCAAGYSMDASGQCVRAAPAGTTLLGAGRVQNLEAVLAIDPAAGTAVALRALPNLSSQRLTSDLKGRILYAASTSGVSRLELATGMLVPLATVQSVGAAAFGSGSLYTLGQLSPYLLKRIEATSGAVADIGPTNLASSTGAVSLAWEAAGTLLHARPPTTPTNGAELVRIDPATATATPLGALTFESTRLRPADTRVALSFDANGKLFVTTRLGRVPEEVVAEHCRKLAAGLGYTGYDNAAITGESSYNGIGAGLTRVLTSKHASGKEIVAYASYGRRTSAKANLRIETTNPDAFVCVSTYEEVIDVQIPMATARFAAIGLSGQRPILTLTVEGSVPPVTRPTLHVFGGSGSSIAPAFNGGAGGYQFSKLYTSSEWSALRLPTYVSAWDTDAGAPTVLLEVDLTTRAVTRTLSFKGVELYPSLTAWAP